MTKNNNLFTFAFIVIISIFCLSCATMGIPQNVESIPVNWGDWSEYSGSSPSERSWSQVVRILDRNVRHYNYFIYTHSINEKSHQMSWDHELTITTFSNGETIKMVFNYFSVQFHYTNNRDLRINGIPTRFSTIRGSVNEINSLLDRISLLLSSREFHNRIDFIDDSYWLDNLRLRVVDTN